jgi:hypothetical protein
MSDTLASSGKKSIVRKRLWQPLLAGGFGCVFPFLVRLGVDLLENHKNYREINLSFILGLLIFLIVGAPVVFFFRESNRMKAFFLGISTPSLITIGTLTATTPTGHASEKIVQAAGQVNVANRNARIYLSGQGSESVNQLRVVFRVGLGDEEAREARVGEAVSVPQSATDMRVLTESAESEWIPLPSVTGTTISLTLTSEKKPLYGLYYALGINARPYILSVKSKTLTAFRIYNVETPSDCSVITLKNVTGSASFLWGLRLTDGHSVNLPLNSTQTIQSDGLVEVYLGDGCLALSSNGLTIRSSITGSEKLDSDGGVIRLLNVDGQEVDSRSYGKSSNTKKGPKGGKKASATDTQGHGSEKEPGTTQPPK